MRSATCSLLALLLATLGCGGGGGGDDREEVVLATWPVEMEMGSSDDFERVEVGFAVRRTSSPLDPVLVLATVVDRDEGLQQRIEAADGGALFVDQVEALTDGLDTTLRVTFDDPVGRAARLGLESETLVALVPAGPDLRGSSITAFQLDLRRVEIGPDTTPPPELRVAPGPGASRATRALIAGEIRILGFASAAD